VCTGCSGNRTDPADHRWAILGRSLRHRRVLDSSLRDSRVAGHRRRRRPEGRRRCRRAHRWPGSRPATRGH
jgi:hypothetical protein